MTDLTQTNREAEMSLVGAMILDPVCIADVVDVCSGKDYTDRNLGQIHDVIVGVWSDGREVERGIVAATVEPWLSDLVTEAYGATGTSVNARFHAGLIRDAATRREIVAEGTVIIGMAKEDDLSLIHI